MIKHNIDSIAEKLHIENKNILILDTCSLLDVIRCIQREKLTALESALEIIELYDKRQHKFEMVIPSLFETEWCDNFESVKIETDDFIRKFDRSQKYIMRCFEKIFSKNLSNVYFCQYNFSKLLLDFCDKILSISLCLESNNECKLNAIDRVAKHTPPAKRGKDSTKDCIIFEEILLLSSLLRTKGFTKKIIFTTSNTKEYYKDGNLFPEIEKEIIKYGITIVTTLDHGYFCVQKTD